MVSTYIIDNVRFVSRISYLLQLYIFHFFYFPDVPVSKELLWPFSYHTNLPLMGEVQFLWQECQYSLVFEHLQPQYQTAPTIYNST